MQNCRALLSVKHTHTPVMHAASAYGRISLSTYHVRQRNAEGSYITTLHYQTYPIKKMGFFLRLEFVPKFANPYFNQLFVQLR